MIPISIKQGVVVVERVVVTATNRPAMSNVASCYHVVDEQHAVYTIQFYK